MTGLPDLLAARAEATPDATALVFVGDGATWTYGDLDRAADDVARGLAGHGVGPGDRVAVLAENRPAYAHLVFAVQRLGAVLVPLNARLAGPQLARQLSRVDPALVVCEGETTADARAAAADAPVASVDGGSPPALDDAGAPVEPATWSLDDDAVLAFTSGTTGDPKAVRLTAGNLLASAVASAVRLGVEADDRWLCPLSLYHVGGLSVLLRSTLYGTTTLLQRGFDAGATRSALEEHDATCVSLVPTMLRRLLDDGPLPDLRFVLLGGAPVPEALLERCAARDVPACPTYGLTETASQVATARPAEARADPGTVGRPLFGTRVTVLDADGDPAPTGDVGELAVAGPTVSPGYLDAEAPVGPHGLRTGDLGRRDDAGRLWLHGRVDDAVSTGGETVVPETVAAALRSHPGVRDAAVVGLADPEWGERVAALVVPADARPDPDGLREHCADRLADFEVPKTLALADSLPRTPSGTVDREAVRERLRDAGG